MRIVSLAALACVFLATACAAPHEETVSQADLIADGRAMAEAECSGCHAVGEYGESPMNVAPPFRTLLSRYRAEVLEEELIQGIHIAHPMPEFQFNPQGVDGLIAYLKSIQEQPAPAQ